MELSGLIVVVLISFLNSVQSEDYGLTVTPEHVNVDVGAHPTFTCAIKKAANFLIEHPIKWERHGRDGSKEIISVLANVESVLDKEYHVKLTTSNNNDGMSFSLTFHKGILNKYDGFFKCVLYHNDTFILAQKQVEVHVIKMFSKMEFGLDTKKQVNVGNSPVHIRLKEGTYNSLCKTEGSNPAADIKIFLDDVEETDVITTLEDKDRTEPPQAWNVENRITLTLNLMDKNKILKCVAMVNNEILMKKEMSYKLDVYSVRPEIKCGNFSAMSGDKFVDMTCRIELKGISCTDKILWENGNTGEQYKVDPPHEGYQVFCENVDRNTVKTTFRIKSVKSLDFETDFFVLYANKHGSTTKHITTIHQEYSSASSLQYGIYLMCSTIVAVALLL